jgi:hypothetical protein
MQLWLEMLASKYLLLTLYDTLCVAGELCSLVFGNISAHVLTACTGRNSHSVQILNNLTKRSKTSVQAIIGWEHFGLTTACT